MWISIDILSKDHSGKLCIVELKVTNNDKRIINQCNRYPTYFKEDTRVITIAPSYDEYIDKQLKSLGYVEQMVYEIIDDNLLIKNAG